MFDINQPVAEPHMIGKDEALMLAYAAAKDWEVTTDLSALPIEDGSVVDAYEFSALFKGNAWDH